MIIRPTPGLYQRWQVGLKGALIAFGMVTLLGASALLIDSHSDPAELQRLRQVIEFGNFTDYTLEDLQRLKELEDRLAVYQGIDFRALGGLLINAGLRLFALCAILIAVQNFVRWLWFGSDPN
jgi:hypothetical protein